MKLPRWILAISVALAALSAHALQPIGSASSSVEDRAGLLSVTAQARLRDTLRSVERRFGCEIVILTVRSTSPESIDAFSLRVAKAWRPGRAGRDDGVLIVVARDDRGVRIEVGRGLETAVSDVAAKRIIEGQMTPAFREGDYALGIERAVEALEGLVSGEAPPASATRSASRGGSGLLVSLMLFGGIVGGRLLRGAAGRFVSALVIGVVAGSGAWWLTGSPAVAVLAGLGAAVLGFVLEPGHAERTYGGQRSGTGDWEDEAEAHRWDDGGGGFGGGGASGRW